MIRGFASRIAGLFKNLGTFLASQTSKLQKGPRNNEVELIDVGPIEDKRMKPKHYLIIVIVCSVLFAGGLSPGRSAEKGVADIKARSPAVVWSGAHSAIEGPAYMRITSERQWRDLWLRHSGIKPKGHDELHNSPCIPTVDFSRFMVIAVFNGKLNCTQGIRVRSVTEDAKSLRVRFSVQFYAHFREDITTPYGILVLPRVSKSVIVEQMGANGAKGKPTWHKKQEFPPLKKKN